LPRPELIAADTDQSGIVKGNVRATVLRQHSLARLDIEIFNGSSRHGPLPLFLALRFATTGSRIRLGSRFKKRLAHKIVIKLKPGSLIGCRIASCACWQISPCSTQRLIGPGLLGFHTKAERMRPAEPRKPGRGSLNRHLLHAPMSSAPTLRYTSANAVPSGEAGCGCDNADEQ